MSDHSSSRSQLCADASALAYAQSLAAAAAKHYGPPEGWKPLDDMMGALSQIDNALTGLSRTTDWQLISEHDGSEESVLAICASAYTPTAFEAWFFDGKWWLYSRGGEKQSSGVTAWFPTHWMPKPSPASYPSREALNNDEPDAAHGFTYYNPDTGFEWSENHPVESGEVSDATDIQPATYRESVFAQGWYSSLGDGPKGQDGPSSSPGMSPDLPLATTPEA